MLDRSGGLSQGVGFRPFVYNLALRHALGGSVRNLASSVAIEVEGAPHAIERFVDQLQRNRAPRALLRCEMSAPRGESAFRIEPSAELDARAANAAAVFVPADIATCDACLAELFDDNDRRAGHAFINCTQCGPRASIVLDMPYDRERTSMAGFAMCARCKREHDDPSDRRFHAQPIACKDCGPTLRVLDASGGALPTVEPIATLAEALLRGQIAAVKGIGGFHLICDALSAVAVQRLRTRKGRPGKPFAVMVASVAVAEAWAQLDAHARLALRTPERPIVLVPKRPGHAALPESVAPSVGTLGIMLPYTPLQHLLFRELQARGHAGPLAVTSGNRSASAIAINDGEALERLAGVADLYVTHDRAIELPYEDSVIRAVHGRSMPLRRARGHAPLPLELPIELALDLAGVPTLALGGHLKAVFALGHSVGDESSARSHIVLSPCFGDLEAHDSYSAWSRAIEQFERVFRFAPARIAHDLHPEYASSRYALTRCDAGAIERVAVQHHHAHMASCMLEHGLTGEVIGVCFDGSGLGDDGTLWGGEWLTGGYAHALRSAHLMPMPLVGGDRAAREPWRIALAYARAADAPASIERLTERVEPRALRAVHGLIDRFQTGAQASGVVPTSSMGRLFDAVAALLGLSLTTSYEGEPAMQLEALASRATPSTDAYGFELSRGATLSIDVRPMVREIDRALSRGAARETIALRFHNTVVEMIARVCGLLRERSRLQRVVLSGGVFANALITTRAVAALRARDFEVYVHERVPTNDGGLCLGQLAVAAHAGLSTSHSKNYAQGVS